MHISRIAVLNPAQAFAGINIGQYVDKMTTLVIKFCELNAPQNQTTIYEQEITHWKVSHTQYVIFQWGASKFSYIVANTARDNGDGHLVSNNSMNFLNGILFYMTRLSTWLMAVFFSQEQNQESHCIKFNDSSSI
jgi:hypothetical protein